MLCEIGGSMCVSLKYLFLYLLNIFIMDEKVVKGVTKTKIVFQTINIVYIQTAELDK